MSRTLRRRSARSVTLAGLAAAAGLVVAAPIADAASDGWSCSLASGSYCSFDRHSLVSVSNYSAAGRTAGSAASTTTGTGGLYGSWAWGNGYSCHSYGGGNLLYPLIKNGSSVGGSFQGGSTFGSGASSC